MIKNPKFIVIVLGIIFVSFTSAFPTDKDKLSEERTKDEKTPVGIEVVIPEAETGTLQGYNIPWSSLNAGGLDMASTNYKVMVSSAQSAIGESQSTNYQMQIGYWYGAKPFVCGDPNGSGNVSLSDIVYLISYLFKFGPAPDPIHCEDPPRCGDANGDGKVSLSDMVYLIAYLFKSGPPPEC